MALPALNKVLAKHLHPLILLKALRVDGRFRRRDVFETKPNGSGRASGTYPAYGGHITGHTTCEHDGFSRRRERERERERGEVGLESARARARGDGKMGGARGEGEGETGEGAEGSEDQRISPVLLSLSVRFIRFLFRFPFSRTEHEA